MADPAAQVAEVVVEARPRLVGDEVEVDVLALGQAEQRGRCARGSPRRASRWPARSLSTGDGLGLAPRRCSARRSGPLPGSTSSRARWAASNSPRRPSRGGRRSSARPRRRRRWARRRGARPWCAGRAPGPAASGAGAGRRARRRPATPASRSATSRRASSARAAGARTGSACDPRRELGRPVVGVDQAVDVAVEPQARARGSGRGSSLSTCRRASCGPS